MSSLRRAALAAVMGSLCLVSSALALGTPARAVLSNGEMAVQDLVLKTPADWKVEQDALSDGTVILGFSHGDDAVTIYVAAKTGLDMKAIFVNDSQIVKDVATESHSGLNWSRLSTTKTSTLADGDHTFFVSAFLSERNGFSYYGYARSENGATADANAALFLNNFRAQTTSLWGTFSLTGKDYTGKKYYFGFGDKLDGEMGNEVKYDILHTHDIFTKDVGGDYIGTTQLEDDESGDPSIGHGPITEEWARLKALMTSKDMFVEYSSGHGSTEGLMSGVSYDEIRDNALSMPAQEIVIFTMACYSGNLIDSFNNRKRDWQNWRSQGRTLMVMSSSRDDESSVTGPGTDPDEPNGPDGSAGSAFGYSLWKALIGYSDGYVDGVKDGFISLGEIRDFTRWKTMDIGGHTPQITGVFNPSLIMNRVPPKAFLASLKGGTEGMTDAEVAEKIRELDRSFRIH